MSLDESSLSLREVIIEEDRGAERVGEADIADGRVWRQKDKVSLTLELRRMSKRTLGSCALADVAQVALHEVGQARLEDFFRLGRRSGEWWRREQFWLGHALVPLLNVHPHQAEDSVEGWKERLLDVVVRIEFETSEQGGEAVGLSARSSSYRGEHALVKDEIFGPSGSLELRLLLLSAGDDVGDAFA